MSMSAVEVSHSSLAITVDERQGGGYLFGRIVDAGRVDGSLSGGGNHFLSFDPMSLLLLHRQPEPDLT